MSEKSVEEINEDADYGFEIIDVDRRRKYDREDKKSYDVKMLWQLSHEIINLKAMGYKNVDIARILNCTPVTVSNTINSSLGQKKLAKLRFERDEEAKVFSERIRYLTHKALDTYDNVFKSDDENVTLVEKAKVAKDVLNDLSGLKVAEKSQASSTHVSLILSNEQIEAFRQRGLEAIEEPKQINEPESEEETE